VSDDVDLPPVALVVVLGPERCWDKIEGDGRCAANVCSIPHQGPLTSPTSPLRIQLLPLDRARYVCGNVPEALVDRGIESPTRRM
jgi:hypothetical protein